MLIWFTRFKKLQNNFNLFSLSDQTFAFPAAILLVNLWILAKKHKQFCFKMITKISTFIFCLTVVSASKLESRCSTLSCVHASAAMITKINSDIDPCEDFYEFACGEFKEDQHTPDEKTTVDTIALMGDKLIEFLLTLLEQTSSENDSKLHVLARKFYRSCLDYGNSFLC